MVGTADFSSVDGNAHPSLADGRAQERTGERHNEIVPPQRETASVRVLLLIHGLLPRL